MIQRLPDSDSDVPWIQVSRLVRTCKTCQRMKPTDLLLQSLFLSLQKSMSLEKSGRAYVSAAAAHCDGAGR